ncbi:MAG: carbohydrate kinase family protein [Woeseiaceae bacterium]|nr:carbohydrate kinase family protein [Woeseiaceae bacterium]
MTNHDVYAYGVVSSSTLYGILGGFPAPEGYAEVNFVRRMTGGEAANSSIVLSRLGATVKLDGSWLGADENGKRTKALLSEYSIDTERLPLRDGINTVEEVVFAAQDTRTIFGTYGRLLENKAWNRPTEVDIVKSRIVCLDPFFAEPAARVAEIAFGAGIPVVTIDCRYDDPLLQHTSAIVIAESFIREHYGESDLNELFARYRAATGGLVIFSFGARPIWYARPDDCVRQFAPFPIEPADTAGGGDSFRAGIVYGLLKGWDDEKMIQFAAAVAAINCTRFPGVLNSPASDEVLDFIAAYGRPGFSV